jgi:hypothetical protein
MPQDREAAYTGIPVDEHKDDIWQRRSAREIMREARRRFAESVEFIPSEFEQPPKPASAHVALASAHYSLVKRYMKPRWKLPLAVWHLWRAAIHARMADKLGLQSYDQTDVVSTILVKAPRLLGGNLRRGEEIIMYALTSVSTTPEQEVMKPHTRVFLLIRLGEIDMKQSGDVRNATIYYKRAQQYVEDITDEQQECRVLRSIGVFYIEHGDGFDEWQEGRFLLRNALKIARGVSQDQLEVIKAELPRLEKIMDRRGLLLDIE